MYRIIDIITGAEFSVDDYVTALWLVDRGYVMVHS